MQWTVSVRQRWDGTPLDNTDVVRVVIDEADQEIDVQFTAHLLSQHIIPSGMPTFTHGLWDYDVVEVFFARPDGSYLEIEVGPGGHWLVYEFTSYRQASDKTPRPLSYHTNVHDGVWSGAFAIPSTWLGCPLQECRVNVYQIRNTEAGREYLAWRSLPTIAPDFHRVECFGRLE